MMIQIAMYYIYIYSYIVNSVAPQLEPNARWGPCPLFQTRCDLAAFYPSLCWCLSGLWLTCNPWLPEPQILQRKSSVGLKVYGWTSGWIPCASGDDTEHVHIPKNSNCLLVLAQVIFRGFKPFQPVSSCGPVLENLASVMQTVMALAQRFSQKLPFHYLCQRVS